MTDPLVGTAVAHYEVIAKLGGGGMGVVYTARDVRLGRLVALKFLPPQWSHDDSAKQRFLREAQAASATHHRNICTIHDIETAADGQLFIVMAYYEGQTLKQKLESGPLPIEEAVEIAAQVAEGLAKAHAEGVVHRDIKPGNLIVVEDDVKILDFGLAKFANALQLTMEGSTLGTVAYMSPEQTRGEEADARSDIWAVGVVLYEMLTGALPFKGAYPEAISHAIRNDPVPSMRTPGRDIPPELIRIIERALQKVPEERFQSVRELARDLRLLQGRTIPLDLLTAPINAPALRIAPPRRWWRSRASLAAAAIAIIAGVGAPLWIFAPVARVPVVVAPVVNQTGYPELDPYRAALTQELIGRLSESAGVRVLPYDRQLQILRRFRAAGQDVSSREATQALTINSGAQVLIVPTLLYENGAWRARVEFQDAATAASAATLETPTVVSSLMKDTIYSLVSPMTIGIEQHFRALGPKRARMADALRRAVGRGPQPPLPRMRSLDVAATFEQALDAYEQLEYASALQAFTRGVQDDPRNVLLLAWRSRSAQLMRRDNEASEAGDQAVRLLSDRTPLLDRLFVQAVAAEAHRDFESAEARYRELATAADGEAPGVLELAAFLDRRGTRNQDAVVAYQQALTSDERLPRPELDLCRVYNRLNEGARAKQHGQLALTKYRQVGARGGEAQALFCLTDALRVGDADERRQATDNARMALVIIRELGQPYNLARAYNYVALAQEAQGNLAEAAASWEQALAAARTAGNIVLEPLVLMNLGVTYDALGSRARALASYRDGQARYEVLGDQARAAEIQANIGAILIGYGAKPEEGLRDVQNALAVFRQLGNRNFEVTGAQTTAEYFRYAGRHADAERELNRAIAQSRERGLDYEIATSLFLKAESRFDVSDYSTTRDLLLQAMPNAQRKDSRYARILLARTLTRLGDFAAAAQQLTTADAELRTANDTGSLPQLHLAMGELAYESGRLAEARAHFVDGSAMWVDDLPDPASVEARCHAGFTDASTGKSPSGRGLLVVALDQAIRMHYVALTTRCRILLARLDVGDRRFDAAIRGLDEIPPDGASQTVGGELRAQERYWRSVALSGKGDAAGALQQATAAQATLSSLAATFADSYRYGFLARPDIRAILR